MTLAEQANAAVTRDALAAAARLCSDECCVYVNATPSATEPQEAEGSVVRLGDVLAERDALAARLAAVEALHRPAHAIFNWHSGLRYEDPCPDCHGKAGVHPCGCWSDQDTEYVCRECDQPKNGWSRRQTPWPCPTARAALATGTDQ